MMRKLKNYVFVGLTALFFGLLGSFLYSQWFYKNSNLAYTNPESLGNNGQLINQSEISSPLFTGVNFVKASEIATPSVVFVKTTSAIKRRNWWDEWFGYDISGRRELISGAGSGVIISDDGYIATNNHVIEGADKIEVILNNGRKVFEAKVIGKDPSTDLALLKIEAKNLIPLKFGNSDDLKIGEWVIAVGNPFNLNSTVTAGIVSAKGRNINVVSNQFPIESFIQTDAAINPGNSGGALVDDEGLLVGINTAIASSTGAYTGYGFAIPSNMAYKIIGDLRDYGKVQRAYSGLEVINIEGNLYEKLGQVNKGVFVNVIQNNGPAAKSGILEGDVLLSINNRETNDKASFDEQLAYYRPGDKVKFKVLREGKTIEKELVLVNSNGTTEMVKDESVFSKTLGADFEEVNKIEQEKYRIKYGIKVTNIRYGRIREMSIPDGFIIIRINGKDYYKAEEAIKDLESIRGRLIIEGINPNGSQQYFSFYVY